MGEPGITLAGVPASRWDRIRKHLEHHGNRRFRPVGTWLYRITGGRIAPARREIVLLTTRGRRTGREHTVLIQAFPDSDDLILVAANAGMGTLPDWYRNLFAAGEGTVERRGQRLVVRPVEIDHAAARGLWPGILQKAPSYARYVALAGRELPLVRLVPGRP